MARLCPGRVVGARGVTARIENDGRAALLERPDPASDAPAGLDVEWDLGDVACEYRVAPPFFLEGPPAIVDLLGALLAADH
jgi:hypothetical protein